MTKYKNDSKKKRYYWLQLKTDFFEQKEIKLLRKIAGGDTFTIIYLKMLLASLKDDGKLYFEAIGDNFAEEVALLVDEDPENVSLTISFLESKGLLEIVEDDEYFLNKVPEMVGSEGYSTERVRRHRAKKALQSNTKTLHCNTDVTKRRDRDREELELENNKPSKSLLTEQFNKLWKEYPNKKGKENAFKSYKKAVKDDVADETILDGIRRYKKEIEIKHTEQQYICHGSTFFSQRRWEDDYQTEPEQPQMPHYAKPTYSREPLENEGSSDYDNLPF